MKILKYLLLILLWVLFFLPNSSYGASGIDFPLGAPNATGYAVEGTGGLDFLDRYDYQGDGILEFHPGEDWNEAKDGKDYGSDNNDFGDPIYAIGDGIVKYAKFHSSGWGNLVMVEHKNGDTAYWSQYAHMSNLGSNIYQGKAVTKGEIIGYVGAFPYGSRSNIHLHFEIRKVYREAFDFVYDWPQEKVLQYYYNPTDFINSHRPVSGQTLSIASGGGNKLDLSWTKAEDPRFDKYEIYRSLESGGTLDSSKRTLVYSSSDPAILLTSDTSGLSPGSTYYYRLFTYFKSGQIAESNEVNIGVARNYVNITNHPDPQQYPTIDGNIITWQDNRILESTDYRKLYYFDISTGKIETIGINIEGLRSNAGSPFIKGKYVIYTAQDMYFNSTGTNLYAVDLELKRAFPITQYRGEQQTPVVSDDGIVVWADSRSGNLDLYYMNLNNSEGEKEFVIANKSQRNPRIWGNKVIWKDSRANTKYDLYLKEIGGQEEKVLATTVGLGSPDIWENWVTWVYDGKVTLMNISTKETKILADKGAEGDARVRDNKVAYSINENGTYYIYVYDILTGKVTKLDIPITVLPFVAISGNTVVFTKDEPKTGGAINTDIYYTVL